MCTEGSVLYCNVHAALHITYIYVCMQLSQNVSISRPPIVDHHASTLKSGIFKASQYNFLHLCEGLDSLICPRPSWLSCVHMQLSITPHACMQLWSAPTFHAYSTQYFILFCSAHVLSFHMMQTFILQRVYIPFHTQCTVSCCI